MMWLWIIGSVVLAVVLAGVVLTVLGRRLPEEHVGTRSIVVSRPVEEVWGVIADVAGHVNWAKGVTKVEKLPDRDGHEAYRQHMGRNAFVLVTTRSEPPRVLVRTIDDDAKMFSGSWTYELMPEGGGTRVTLTEHGRVGPALPRAMMHYFMDPAMYVKKHLKSLAGKFGEEARWG